MQRRGKIMTGRRISRGLSAVVIFSLLAAVGALRAAAEEARPFQLLLEVSPTLSIPLGNSALYFGAGGGIGVDVAYPFEDTPFFVNAGMDYTFTPTTTSRSVSLFSVTAGGGAEIPVAPKLSVLARGQAGWWFGTYNDTALSSSNPCLSADAGVRLALSPAVSVELVARYDWLAGLSQGLSVSLGTGIVLGGSAAAPLSNGPAPQTGPVPQPLVLDVQPSFSDAFPVFFKYYDDHPIGMIRIKNGGDTPISNVRVQFLIKQYMDEPKEMTVDGSIPPGGTAETEVYALLTDNILTVTEGTKSAAQLVISYDQDGQRREDKKVVTVSFYGRNAMTWDDDRKAAAYVTAKDAQVLSFSRSVTSSVQHSETRAINDNLQAAIGLHEALDLYGLNYVPSPTMPYAEASKQKNAVDFLQFPRETLEFKAGDCSDISILYSALMEAVGIETAFITIPGHIFVAFNTKLTPTQASDAFIPQSEYIAWEGQVWLPVEITLRHRGFLKAWELGAKEWNENNPRGLAAFYRVQDAWKVYQPVGLPGTSVPVSVPGSDQVLGAYRVESTRWVDNATLPLIQKLQEEIEASGSAAAGNRLGILYARFGQKEKAELEFRRALERGTYMPAILNLGNLYFMQEKWKQALQYYQQAFNLDPKNPHALLAIARADQQLSKFDDMRQTWGALKGLDPELAGRFAYLGERNGSGERASDVASEWAQVLWEAQ
jgi:tetratricopeptide (TPR) repeat protein